MSNKERCRKCGMLGVSHLNDGTCPAAPSIRELLLSEGLKRNAAPDLYEALTLYVEHFGDPLKVARPALAKARGESA